MEILPSMDAYVAQWIGTREKMEDAYAVTHLPEGTLAIVCDGMGGHRYGDCASAEAAAAFKETFCTHAGQPLLRRLRTALEEANAAVGRLFREKESFGGTTLLAVYVTKGLLYHISVGDSGLFLWRNNSLKRLNEDHSMRPFYQGLGAECALPESHALRSALVGEPLELVDSPDTPYPLLPQDRIILTTDGTEHLLYSCRPGMAVSRLLNTRSGVLPLAAALVQAAEALQDPYADNATVVSLDV